MVTASIYNPAQTVSPKDYIEETLTNIAKAKQQFEIAVDNAEKEAARSRLYLRGPRVERQASAKGKRYNNKCTRCEERKGFYFKCRTLED
jgi:hypothetical protein